MSGKSYTRALRCKTEGFFVHCALISSFLLAGVPCFGQMYFDWSPGVESVYDRILDLRLGEAELEIGQLRLREKDNLCLELLENYVDFLTAFISEKEVDLAKFKEGKDRRLERIKEGQVDSPFYLFSQAQIHMQSALVRLKFKEYLGAFNDVSHAYSDLEYNERRFPDFIPNTVSLGLLKAMVGTIPDSYQWGVRLLGMKGDLQEGLNEIIAIVEADHEDVFWLKTEATVMCAMGLLHLAKQPDRAWALIEQLEWDPQKSLLAAFVKANIAGRTGHNDKVIKYLKERPVGREFMDFWYLEYMIGEAKLRQLDPGARGHLMAFVEHFEGRNHIQDAYRKLAWYELIFNQGKRFDDYVQRCLVEGESQVDADKSALRWAQTGKRPHLILLQARLLYDGGDYDGARSLLEDLKIDELNSADQLEWWYRMARCHHGMRNLSNAIRCFEKVLEYPTQSYMVANSALQLGLIYEEKGQMNMAYTYFTMCRDLKSDEYENSLNQKAKAGLQRVR